MQIHELPVGSPASGVQFAGDTGSQTQKIDYDALADAILNKLTTKTFDIKSESQTIIAALNALGDASKQDVANNLVTTAAGLVLDARQGKALDDKITTLNSSISNVQYGTLRSGYSGAAIFVRIGRVVIVNATITSSSGVSALTDLVTDIPRPAVTNAAILARNNSPAGWANLLLRDNGAIMNVDAISTQFSLRTAFSYICAQ